MRDDYSSVMLSGAMRNEASVRILSPSRHATRLRSIAIANTSLRYARLGTIHPLIQQCQNYKPKKVFATPK